MRVATKHILAVNYELIKHLRPSPAKWGSVFYGRQNTLAVNGTTTRWRGKRNHKPRRWVVERLLGWLSKFRGILVRYDKNSFNYLGIIHIF